ncbi:MAG TPA: PAS domain S-box protein [Polyangiaceae bacterium]|nr:PAS domain S-box protein [Polyangiaceae bacterium]
MQASVPSSLDQAEELLRKSEQRFRGYFEFGAVGLAISTPDKGLVEVNNRFCELLGYSRDEVLRKSWSELTHPEDIGAELREFDGVLAGRSDGYTIGKRMLRKDGELIHAEVSVRCVRAADGSVECFLGLLDDVSERVRAERALRESVELFTKVFRAIPDAVSVSDEETGLFVDVNEGFERLFGVRRVQVIGKNSLDLLFWNNPKDRVELVRRVRENGSVQDFPAVARVANGELKSCLLSAESVEIAGRVRMIVVVRDVSERERAERALRESEQKFLTAFRASPNAVAISDLESGCLLEVNESFERMVGRTRDKLVGYSSVALGMWAADERKRFIDTLVSKGVVRDLELTSTNFEGKQLVMQVNADVTELNGKRCIILVAHDITERRRAEEAKARLEDELRQMQRLEAMGTLAGGVAHDFNNILGAIVAYTDLARMDAQSNAAVLESLSEVSRASERAKLLVRQILAFSRRQPQERHAIRLQPLVKEVLRLVRSTLPTTIEISSEVSADAGHVDADTTQLHQVLVNLCTNAAHAMRGAPGRLTLCLVEVDVSAAAAAQSPGLHAGRYVRVSVCDTGHGMDAATTPRIFEPFFTTKKPGEGTGLGLSVVHGIVTDHGGVIQVESKPGAGTKMHVLLPLRAAAAPEQEQRVLKPPLGQGQRVLFIDDEPALCVTAQKLLERLNYKVHTETSAVDALALFRKEPARFDLVLTDLTMPLMTGVDVAREVLRVRPDLPVLVATGFNASWSRETVRALGVRDLVLKPLSAAALAEAIHSALNEAARQNAE